MNRNHFPSRLGWVRVGFTLIELLMVVSIITLLVAMLSPTLSRARHLTRAVICRSNLHAQGVGLQTYVATYKFYPGGHTAGGIGTYIVWAPRIRMFASTNCELFNCPSAPASSRWTLKYGSGLPKRWGYLADEQPLYWNTVFSYGYNNWGQQTDFVQPQRGLGGYAEWKIQGNVEDWDAIEASRVVLPQDMIAIGDARIDNSWDAFIDPQTNESDQWPNDLHLDRANILFCDAHTEPLTIKQLADPFTDDAGKARWNTDNKRHD